MFTKNLEWMIFESARDMYEKYPDDFKLAFAEEFEKYKKECFDITMSEKDMLDDFLDEYLFEYDDEPFLTFGWYWVKKNGYKAVTLEIKYFSEDVEDDGIAKHVIDIEQVVPTDRQDLEELITVYCENNEMPLPEILIEKLIP